MARVVYRLPEPIDTTPMVWPLRSASDFTGLSAGTANSHTELRR